MMAIYGDVVHHRTNARAGLRPTPLTDDLAICGVRTRKNGGPGPTDMGTPSALFTDQHPHEDVRLREKG